MQTGMQWIEDKAPDLISLADAIWQYAEVGLKELRSAASQAAFLEAEGFSVKMGVAGMPSALVASFGGGSRSSAIWASTMPCRGCRRRSRHNARNW